MAFDGNGAFNRLFNWAQDAANGINITASRVDGEDSGIAAGLTLAVTRDGQGKMAADFTPATDNVYNLGTNIKRWTSINSVPFAQFGTYPNSTFDTSQTVSLIGNAGTFATNLWLSTGTAGTRPQEVAAAFEYVSSGGGTFNDDSKFGVALYAAAKLTGGSRAIWAINSVTEIGIAAQASAFGAEMDFNNNSGTDAGSTAGGAFNQMVGVRAASGGTNKPQVGFQTWTASAANRWLVGAGLANWSSYGLVIVQDPGTAAFDASGTNNGTVGAAVTGPCILLQPSSDGGGAVIRLLNAGNTAVSWQLLQNGGQVFATNANLSWVGSDAVVRSAVVVTSGDDAYFMAAKNSGRLTDQSLSQKVTWNTTGLGFFGTAPVAQPTGYGTPTGNAYQPSFAAGSITLANLAAAVAQLIIDLKTGKLGLLGA